MAWSHRNYMEFHQQILHVISNVSYGCFLGGCGDGGKNMFSLSSFLNRGSSPMIACRL